MELFLPPLVSAPHVFIPPDAGALTPEGDLELTPRRKGRVHHRLAPSGLFLRFAALSDRQADFEEFASLFGPLKRSLLDGEEPRETLAEWRAEHQALARAVESWKVGASTAERLADAIDDHIGDAGVFTFVWPEDANQGRSALPNGIVIRPRDLLGLLWLQFASAVEREAEFQQCEICPNWFEVRHDRVGRGTRRYCSGACRIEAHRRVRDHQGHRNDEGPGFEREKRRPSVRHPDASGDKA